MEIYELHPRYDMAKSFYGKAKIIENGKEKTLLSYDIKVCTLLENGNIFFYGDVCASQTTLRHVKEFMRQYMDGYSYPEYLLANHKKEAKNFKQLFIFLQGKTINENYDIE